MPLLEPVNPEMLKNYPYFTDWLKELGRDPADVLDFAISAEVAEVPSDTQWKKFEPTGNYTASITFKDGTFVERPGKWSDGQMRYLSGKENEVSNEQG